MRTIVMTGGTSGIGWRAARELADMPDVRLLVGSRGKEAPTGVETVPLDLASLQGVRDFASDVTGRLKGRSIDALVLNAGGSFPFSRTVDGIETNFAVNHLAGYLLLRVLEPHLSQGATVVMTASGTHDPEEKTVLPPPRHADAFLLAYPDRDPQRDTSPMAAAGRAYASSKLCVVLTARAFAQQDDIRQRNISVFAYDPGPVPGTGLIRDRGVLIGFVWNRLLPFMRRFRSNLNSIDATGAALATLALGRMEAQPGWIYVAFRNGRLAFRNPSTLARRDDLMHSLWRDSGVLAGLEEPVTAK